MGLLDQVVGGLMGSGGTASPLQGVIMNMLSGASGGAPASSGGYPGQTAGGTGGGLAAGLGGLVSAFQQAGLGQVVQSWIGTGSNQSVSPGQLQSVFGQQRVDTMAGQAGMSSGDFLSQLSHHLPHVVDSLTPNGHLPDEGSVSV